MDLYSQNISIFLYICVIVFYFDWPSKLNSFDFISKSAYNNYNILQMSSDECMIEYRVKDAKTYETEKKYKSISQIHQKSDDFRFKFPNDFFEIELNFNTPAIINNFSAKFKETNQVVFEFYNEDKHIHTHYINLQPSQVINGVTKLVKLQDKSQKYDKVIVRFLNHSQAKRTVINHIIFRGFKEEVPKKNLRPKNLSEEDVLPTAQKKKVKDNDKEIFNTRNKQRQIKKTSPDDLIKSVHMNHWNSKKEEKENEQLQKAIQLSKKDHKHEELRQAQNRENKNPQKIDLEIASEENGFFDYEVVEFEKVKKIYEHVTPQWIEAQRNAEKQRDIQARHSVANRIKPKIFLKKEFCINNIQGKQKKRLIDIIKDLGGNVIEQPKNDCIIVTNTMEGGRINLGKSLARVKFVNPSYLDDCYKMKTKLDQKSYEVGSI